MTIGLSPHDYVIKFLTSNKMGRKKIESQMEHVDELDYNGYLLSVLYYMLPDFKYAIGETYA